MNVNSAPTYKLDGLNLFTQLQFLVEWQSCLQQRPQAYPLDLIALYYSHCYITFGILKNSSSLREVTPTETPIYAYFCLKVNPYKIISVKINKNLYKG